MPAKNDFVRWSNRPPTPLCSPDQEGPNHVNVERRGRAHVQDTPKQEALGSPLTLVMPEQFRSSHQNGITRLAQGGSPVLIGKTIELVGMTKTGDEFPVELSLASWTTHDGVFSAGSSQHSQTQTGRGGCRSTQPSERLDSGQRRRWDLWVGCAWMRHVSSTPCCTHVGVECCRANR